jgi:biotin carboxyl carrier protein
MPCKVLRILVKTGDAVKSGDLVCIIESMKMEMKLYAESSGLATVHAAANQVLAEGATLVALQKIEEKKKADK